MKGFIEISIYLEVSIMTTTLFLCQKETGINSKLIQRFD